MKIPPFRNNKKHSSSSSSSSSNNKNNNSTRSLNTTQTEEVGLHSSYIQSQIQIQKERGNWHVDLTNVLQDDDDNEELEKVSWIKPVVWCVYLMLKLSSHYISTLVHFKRSRDILIKSTPFTGHHSTNQSWHPARLIDV